MFNDYHVEEPKNNTIAANTAYNGGANCPPLANNPIPGKLTSAQKFLEYSLYNLSNFVAPATTDLLLIQGAAKLTWNPATKTYYYGNPYTPNTALDDASSAIAGSFTYTADSTVTPLDVGPHTITATFTPTDPNYVSSSITTKITVVSDPTQATIDAIAPPFFYGQLPAFPNGQGPTSVGLASDVDIQVIPPGYIFLVTAGAYNVTIDGTTICSGTAGGAGTCATPTVGLLDAGTHNAQLNYAGTANTDFLPSSSPLYPLTISPDPTATTLTASATTSVNLQPITFTATVADTYTTAVGPVIFYDSPSTASSAGSTPVGAPIGSVTLVNGVATLTSTTVFTGTHNISACFTPALNSLNHYNFLLSCSASTKVVVTLTSTSPVATVVYVNSSANPSAVGQAVTFTASVGTTGAFTATPQGVINFLDGSTVLNGTTVGADGTASFTTSSLAVGTHAITVAYAGNTTFAASTSASLTQVVSTPLASAGTGFLLITNTTGVDVPVGGSGVVQVRIIELNNFGQPVKLTCTGLPAQAACVFATDSLPASGGTTQLSVTAAAPHNCDSNTPYFSSRNGGGALPLLALTGITLCLARRRRKLQGIALAVMLCLLPAVLTGCGNGNCTDFGVKPGTYSFTITATSTGSPAVVKTQVITMNAHL